MATTYVEIGDVLMLVTGDVELESSMQRALHRLVDDMSDVLPYDVSLVYTDGTHLLRFDERMTESDDIPFKSESEF
jgi:hypothetical protein